MKLIKKIFRNLFNTLKFDSVRLQSTINKETERQKIFPSDFGKSEISIISRCLPYTMTSYERLYALIQSVKYVSKNQVEGDIVECGVWRGGSMLAAALTLCEMKDTSRHLYLFDTFEGMTEPTDKDIDHTGASAAVLLEKSKKDEASNIWCYAPFDGVKKLMEDSGYDKSKVHLVKGMVEKTIPFNAPEKISILRLDTDWYESTRHELIHLFPRLSVGAVIIIDDYGCWQGSRLATDEYIEQNNLKILLNRIDDTGRIAIKLT